MAATPYLELRETHSAGLLLVGGTALKFKKPVDLGFLDFTAAETRAAVCAAEVELNRRFAPDVYLGVGRPGPAGRPARAGGGRCAGCPTTGGWRPWSAPASDVRDDLRHLAHLLVAAHGRSERSPGGRPRGRR